MPYRVVFTPEAEDQVVSLYRYIAEAAAPAIAKRFTDAIVAYCEEFREFPRRAIRRDDIRPGLHITNYKGRVVIAFAVEADVVSIISIFYGGRDYETLLQSDLDD